jgi:hypothetical protein
VTETNKAEFFIFPEIQLWLKIRCLDVLVPNGRIRLLAAFWGTLFQLAVSPFKLIDKVMEEVS